MKAKFKNFMESSDDVDDDEDEEKIMKQNIK